MADGGDPAGAGAAGVAGGETTAGVEALGYEAARDELAQVVARLEAGNASLEESLALWERGEALAEVCQRWLDGARARLTRAAEKPGATREAG